MAAAATFGSRYRGPVSTIRVWNWILSHQSIPIKLISISSTTVVIRGHHCPSFVSPSNFGTTHYVFTNTTITIVIISLTLCFFPVIVRIGILGENIVVIPMDRICPRFLPQ
jgi:hypothetical protein